MPTGHQYIGLSIVIFALGACAPAADLVETMINRVKVERPPQHDPASGRDLHSQLFVADLHADTLLWRRRIDEEGEVNRGHLDLRRMEAGNVALQAFTIVTKAPLERGGCIPADGFDPVGLLLWLQGWPSEARSSLFSRATHQIDRLRKVDERTGERFQVIETTDELDELSNNGPVSGFLGLEGGHALEGDENNLDRLEALGLRMFAPTHRFDNDVAASSEGCWTVAEEPKDPGLTPLGVRAVRRALDLDLALDLAHASPKTLRQSVHMALEAGKPTLVSHTGLRATFNIERNMSNDDVKLIAMTNGVVGIGFWKAVVGEFSVDAIAGNVVQARQILAADDIVCWMTAAGYDYDPIDHIALGSDFDGAVKVPFDASDLDQLTAALLARGFTEEQIRRIMGENTRRVLRQAWSEGQQILGRPPATSQCPIDRLLDDDA